MCGIFAAISTGRRGVRPDCASAVARALGAIRHRGPDASGIAVDPAGRFAPGHVRLSVIDVTEESNQPFWSACGRWAIVFNGEIYNYVELRAELEALGVRFREAIERLTENATFRIFSVMTWLEQAYVSRGGPA